MKSVVASFANVARRTPWAVVLVSLTLTGVLGALAGQVEIATGNEGFAPEGSEISASERIGEKFGEESSESILQILIRDPGGDVVTVEGLEAANRTAEAIRARLGEQIGDREERPGVLHYLATVSQAMEAQGIAIGEMTDEMVKSFYIEAIDGDGEFDAPPEQVSFLTRLVSEDFDARTATASAGMVLAFVTPFEGATPDQSFQNQVDAESDLAEDLRGLDTGFEVRPFSFSLLLTGTEDFTQEVGELFALAFVVILVILIFVYWLKPGRGRWWVSIRRTMADTLLTLLTIVMAIGWMQGIGYVLERAGIIDAFSAPTQIVPILLIGLGVDYAIHLTSRYREEAGERQTVDTAMTGAVTTVGVALALATITTVIGFLTNVFNPVPALKDFGILAAVGILVSFVLMLIFVPAVRLLADRRAEQAGTLPVSSLESHGDRMLPNFVEKLALLAEHAPIPTLLVALLLGVGGFYGFSQLETRFSFTDFLPEDSPYVETLDLLESEFGGGFGEQTQILVEATPQRAIDAEVHNALVDSNQELANGADVSTISTPEGEFVNAASPISLLGQMLRGGSEQTSPAVLEAAGAVGLQPDLTVAEEADIRPLYRALSEAAPEQASRVIHFEGDNLDALLWDITTTAGENVDQLRDDLDRAFAPVDELGVDAIDTSQNIIGDVVVTELTESQSASLFLTIAVSALVLMLSFYLDSRRWLLGLITIAPVALVVLWTYGLMFVTGIPFGPVTATLAALAIGIGVPFTIHIARRFQEDRRVYRDMDEAMRSTMRHTGGALAGSAFTTMAGFGVLITSSLVPFRQMGQVTVYAIGLSLVAAVLVLPSMLALWDAYHRRRGDSVIGSEERETVRTG